MLFKTHLVFGFLIGLYLIDFLEVKNQILFMDELDCVMGVIRARSKQSDVENTYDDLDPEHTELMNLYINIIFCF